MKARRDRNDIAAIAAAWVARCDRGPLSAREQMRLDAWLAEDRRHLGAFAQARAVMVHFDRAGALGKSYDPRHFERAHQEPPADRQRRRLLWMAGTGIAAGMVGLALLPHHGRQISTRLGESLRVSLADGSVLFLNSASKVVVRFSQTRRLVRLIQGEAFFDVAKDTLRPFVVEAVQATVVALGTSFAVSRTADAAVRVIVREGTVDFSADTTVGMVRRQLSADMLAVAQPRARLEIESLEPGEVSRRLAWREGMISFEGDTLAEAAREFTRYSHIRIVIDDPAVAHRRVVGLYSATDPVGFAHAVALSMGLAVSRHGDTVHLDAIDSPDNSKVGSHRR